MSNILTPIVARYSLFFTLAMCSSSSISRSKQPTHLVQTLLIEAQQRYQDKSTEKLRALIRHLSTTSTSSSSLSQSALSSSQLTASSGAGSTEISSPSSSSYIQPAATAAALSVSASSSSTSHIEPPSSCLEEKDMPSLLPLLEQEWQEGSFLAAAHNNNCNQSSEHRIKDNKGKSATTTFVSALGRTEHEGNLHLNHRSNHNEESRNSSSPCPPPLIGDGDDAPAAMATAASPPSPSPSHSLSVPVSVSLSFSSPSSSSVAAAQHGQQARQQQSGSNNNHKGNKVNKSSIAALLSVTLTMILLSLLQSKKRHIRRKSRSPKGTTSKRHSRRGSRQLLLAQQQQREEYKSTSTGHLTPRSDSPSSSLHTTNNNNNNNNSSNSNNITFPTDNYYYNSNINMEGTSSAPSEGKRSSLLLTQSRPASFFGGGDGGEPTSAAYHNSYYSLPLSTHGHHILSDPHNNNSLPLLFPPSTSSNPSYPPSTSHFDPTTRLWHHRNMYGGRDIGYSLSDTNLPDKRSKRDLVANWLDQQTFVTPSDMVEAPEHLSLVQDGPNSNIADDNEPLHQFHHHHNAQHYQQQQQQQMRHQRQSLPAQLNLDQPYHQQSINNTDAQREPRQQQQDQQGQKQEHYPRVIQRTNELYLGSRSSLYRSPSASRHSMVALDQQQQQQSSSPSFWRESQSQLQFQQQQQFSPHQYRPQYQHYPQQQHLHHSQHPHPAHYVHYQQQYPQAAVSPTYRLPYEPLGYDDLHQQDANHRRSLSLNNSGGRRGDAGSRPQSQVYRKATPARFENLSLAEQARQEHQLRRQHYQQHYHQHRQRQQQQQLQHQHQHQQYYQAPGSRPESMYSNSYGAAASPRASISHREMNQFVPPHHHQTHSRPHLPPIVMHQHQQHHRHPSDFRHSTVLSPKPSNVSRSVHDLAWERHCYYQQQQMQEDALAERKRIEQQQHEQRQKGPQRPLSSVEGGLQVPLLQGSPSSVVRTSSMSRVSSISTSAVTGGNAASTIGRRTAVGKVALGSSGLSRSVSTSAITDAKARAAKQDKSSHPNLKKNGKKSPTTETETTLSAMDCKFLRLFRSDSKLSAKKMVSANTKSPSTSTQARTASSKEQSTVPIIVTTEPLDSTTPVPSPATATTGLNRRRTLKDLAPSIQSLARRCSSRFSSNNSSSRPNSFAGSSSDSVIQLADGKTPGGGSNGLSMTTSYLPLKLSLTSLPRSLAPGPDGIVDLQQAASPSSSSPLLVKYFPPASASTPSLSLLDMSPSLQQKQQEKHVPIHRKVTLFRSKTLSLARSSFRATSPPSTSHADDTIDTAPSDGMAAADDHDDDYDNNNKNSSTRANSLPSRRRRQRDSLRLANGHGLDIDTFLPPTTSAEDETSAVEKSTNDLESALPGAGLGRSTSPPVLPAIVTTEGRLADMDQQLKARRQIISLLAMGRKDRISAKTGDVMKSGSSTASSPTTTTTASTPDTPLGRLSPLALEALEDLFISPSAAEEKGGEEDPCEKIAFMLVPKSRYEFQPLVVA